MNNPFRSVLFLDVFIVLSILIAGLKFTYGLDTALDIAMADESFDLYRGVTIPRLGLPGASDGPLYNAWYYILSLAETDRVTLYYLNRKMMVILPALAAYVALRAHRVSMIPSLLELSRTLLNFAERGGPTL